MIEPFLEWLAETYPHVRRFEQLDVDMVREYRVAEAQRLSKYGRPLAPGTLHDKHRLLRTFVGWAADEGYAVDLRILRLKGPKVPVQEATVFHLAQLRKIVATCKPELPQEETVVRLLVGSGLRVSEACGLALLAPDGLSDIMLDSLERGRVELRVARVPPTPFRAAPAKVSEASVVIVNGVTRLSDRAWNSSPDELMALVGGVRTAHARVHFTWARRDASAEALVDCQAAASEFRWLYQML